jgi:hypothetical protein
MSAATTAWVAEVLEDMAIKVREQALVDFNITRTAEVEEFGPTEAYGTLWHNRRPTGVQRIVIHLAVETADLEIPANTT